MSTTEMQDVEIRALSYPEKAEAITIVNDVDYVAATEFLKSIKELRAEVEETFGPIVRKAHEAHKEAVAQRKKVEAPLEAAERLIKPRIAGYLDRKERERREEEARLQAEAQKEVEEQQLEEAAHLEASGNKEAAESVLNENRTPAPVVARRPAPKVQGITKTTRWRAEVTDLMELVKAVASGRVPIQALKADTVFLNRQAVALKSAMHYPGVNAVSDSGISAGRR